MLTREELETPRTAADMLQWVYSANERFRATKELRAAAREGKQFAKELVHEALPMALFAERYFRGSSEVTITHALGNQAYDGLVVDNRNPPGPVKYIEVTVSDWSYVEALRAELLNRDGHAPAYGRVSAKGRRGNRTELVAEGGALRHEDICEQHIAGVIAAVKKKSANTYPDGTALVVRVDDAVPFRDQADAAELDRVARAVLVPLVQGREFRVLGLEDALGLHFAYEI